MKVIGKMTIETITEVLCDACGESTSNKGAYPPEFGTLQANWGFYSDRDGDRFEVDLCEGCFFQTLADIKSRRRTNHLFDDNFVEDRDAGFGLITK